MFVTQRIRLVSFLVLLIGLSFCAWECCGDDCDSNDCAEASEDDDAVDDDEAVEDDDATPDDDAFEDPQVELTEPVPLLNPDGTLRARGWARSPLIRYNPEYIPEELQIRNKVWDHFTIVTPRFAFAATISNISFATFASYELVDFEEQKITSGTNLRLGSYGVFPATALESASYQNGDSYMNMLYEEGTRTIEANIEKTLFGCAFTCNITMSQAPGDENPAVAAPFRDQKHYFYEDKVFGMPTSGSLTIDGRTYEFDPADSFAVLDWGRGVWPHATEWHWGVAAGYLNGKIIGFNIGDGNTDDSLGTANAQKFDGKVHKLYHVYFDYDLPNLMTPWKVTSDADKLQATFTPFYHQKTGAIVLDIGMLVDKMFGTFAGKITLDDGSVVEFDNMYGFIERAAQRW